MQKHTIKHIELSLLSQDFASSLHTRIAIYSWFVKEHVVCAILGYQNSWRIKKYVFWYSSIWCTLGLTGVWCGKKKGKVHSGSHSPNVTFVKCLGSSWDYKRTWTCWSNNLRLGPWQSTNRTKMLIFYFFNFTCLNFNYSS